MAKEDGPRNNNAELVRAFTQVAPEKAAQRVSPPSKASNVTGVRPLPKTKLTQDLVINTEARVAAVRAAEQERIEKEKKEAGEGRVFYVRCRPHYHYGIYLKDNPLFNDGTFGMDGWESAYKDMDQPNPYHRDIYCQECMMMNPPKMEPLPVACIDPIRFKWQAEREHIFEIPVDDKVIERDGPEPHRVFPTEWASGNGHFDDRDKKRAAYDAKQVPQKVGA